MSIKDKITKILAKAQGTSNEAEAAIFLAKAQELMEKHQIDLDDLGEADPMGKFVGLTGTSSSPTWMRHLMNQIATFYGASTVRTFTRRDGKDMFDLYVVGAESARITVELMYPFIIEQVRKEGRASAAKMGLASEAAIRRVANALTLRISEMNRQARQERQGPAGEVRNETARNALIVRGTALSRYLEQEFGQLKSSARRSISTNSVAREAAGRVSLHRQTGGSSQLRIGG